MYMQNYLCDIFALITLLNVLYIHLQNTSDKKHDNHLGFYLTQVLCLLPIKTYQCRCGSRRSLIFFSLRIISV